VNIVDVVTRVDAERIYQHVLKLEGVKHPVDSPQKLNEAADYIHSEFEKYGLAVTEHEFKIEGLVDTLRNIEGAISHEDGPELLVTSHYDTYPAAPGADDNASGVAVMLEAARVLAQEKDARNIRFISFMEEPNPVYELRLRRVAQSLGLMDDRHRFTTMHAQKVMRQLRTLRRQAIDAGKEYSEAVSEARSQLEGQMTESERKYVQQMEKNHRGTTNTSLPGKYFCLGSASWVENALRSGKKVLGVINLDMVGYASDKQHSQTYPKGLDPKMLQTYHVNDLTIDNFIIILGKADSGKLIQSFCAQSKLDSIDLPYACLQVPFDYQVIARRMWDLLIADHAPFWRAGIPAISLTDGGQFRLPYYHTPADTIDKLDFDFAAKICKATIATAIDTMTS